MATGLASGTANSILNALCRNITWTPPVAFYVQLHTADPGAAGTTSVAAANTRTSATFSAASAGAIRNSADLGWPTIATAETISHVSFWSGSSLGTFLASDALDTPQTVTVGGSFSIPAGDIALSLGALAA